MSSSTLPFAQYNTVEIVIGSDASCDAFRVGFITDPAHPFGITGDKENPDMSANRFPISAPPAPRVSPTCPVAARVGLNGVERLVRLDISKIDYAGVVALACGSVAPHTMVFAKVTFLNYAEETVKGKVRV